MSGNNLIHRGKPIEPLHPYNIEVDCPVPGSSLCIMKSLSTRAGVMRVNREHLGDLLRSRLLHGTAASYILWGQRGEAVHVRIGEGVKLARRMQEHRRDPELLVFTKIFVVFDVGKCFNKSHAILLQERFTHLAREAGAAEIHQGVGPLSKFPEGDSVRAALEIVIAGAIPILRYAGCEIFDARRLAANDVGAAA